MSAEVLYTVMTGLEATSYRQDIQANNLANVDTPGFREQLGALTSTPFEGAAPDRGMADVITMEPGYSREQGGLRHTGAPLDVALEGGGWLATQTSTGQIVLTQDGQLHVGNDGLLRDHRGDLVLGADKQPISLPPLKHLQIGADGAISGIMPGQTIPLAQQFNQLYIAQTPANPLQRLGGSSFGGVANAAALTRASATRVRQGYLNGSDVNAVQAMMTLIEDTRAFQTETQLQSNISRSNQSIDNLVSQA